jgi:hypothetical protein
MTVKKAQEKKGFGEDGEVTGGFGTAAKKSAK